MKKTLSIILSLTMLMTLFTAMPVSAELSTTTIDGKTFYQIGTAADYLEFVTMANADLTINGILTADIDLSGETVTSIGTAPNSGQSTATSYQGIFDGNNHVIRNMSISRLFSAVANAAIAMFNMTDGATIKNLGIENATITNTGAKNGVFLSALVGRSYGTTIESCYVKNSNIVSNKKNNNIQAAGPIAAFINSTTFVRNCYSTGNNIGFTESGGTASGGVAIASFVGWLGAGTGASNIVNSYAKGNTLLNRPSGQNRAGFARVGSSTFVDAPFEHSYTDKKTGSDDSTTMGYYATDADEWSDGTVLAGLNNGGSAWKADTNGGAPRLSWEPDTYAITIDTMTNGSVSASDASATTGATVVLTVTANRGYAVDWVKVNNEPISAPYSFTMPAAAVTVTAQFKVPWTGSGTSVDPYIISTPEDLNALAYATNGTGAAAENLHYSGVYFKLNNDIDMTGVDYTPIANVGDDATLVDAANERSFRGTFDGNGHVISNLTLDTSGRGPALFGILNGATITDLGIKNSTFRQQGNYRAATLAIYAYDATISGCFAKGCTVNVKSENENPQAAGGLVAQAARTTSISDCYTQNITLRTDKSGRSFGSSAGGLAGQVGAYATISNCYTAGIRFVTVSTAGNVANFARFISTPVENVTNCYTDVKRPRDNETGLPSVTIVSNLNNVHAPLSANFKADYDFENNGYPMLNWETSATPPEHKIIWTGATETDGLITAIKLYQYDTTHVVGKVFVATYDSNLLSGFSTAKINSSTEGEHEISLDSGITAEGATAFKVFVWDAYNVPLAISK